MDHDGSTESPNDAPLGRIPLKQVRVKRGENARATGSVNALVPYLDLFWRLDDEQLGRLAGVEADIVAGLRKQVFEVDRALERYVDLLPRLTDAELVRLTGATEKTIRFWRLCQPRTPAKERTPEPASAAVPRSTAVMPSETSNPAPAEARPAPVDKKRKKREPRSQSEMPAASRASPRPTSSSPEERRDAKVTINPAAQATVDSMMTFSGAPFPGYEDGEVASQPPPDEISLADAEAP